MTATINTLFTRTQFMLLASLLALVFSFSLPAEAATENIDLTVNPADSSIEWVGVKGVTYSFYFDGSKTETKLTEGKSIFAALGNKRGVFTLTPGVHTVTAVGKDTKGVVVSTSAPTTFFAGFDVPKPKVGIPGGESASRNSYPFMAKAISSTQIDLTFHCVVPNADHSCKIYQDGNLIKTFDVKSKDYGRYTTYSVKNLTPNTKYSFVVIEYAKKGSLPDKPRGNTFTYTPTLTLKTPSDTPVTCQAIGCTPTNGKLNFKKFLTSSSTLVSETKDKNQSYGKIDMSFEVEAFEGDVWVKDYAARRVHPVAPQADSAFLYEILKGGVTTRNTNNPMGSAPIYVIKGAEKVEGSNGEKFFKLLKGNTYTVVFSIISLEPTLEGDYSFQVVSLGYNDTPTTADTRVTPINPKDYISKSIFIPRKTVTCQALGCTKSSVTLLSPNGGETYKLTDQMTVNWSAKNVPSTGYFAIQFEDSKGGTVGTTTVHDSSLRSYSIPKLSAFSKEMPLVPGKYRLKIWVAGIPDNMIGTDVSDTTFTLVGTSAPVGKDTTAPSVPGTATVTNLRAVTDKGWTVTLGWGKSTDTVGVTEYVVKQLAPTPVTTVTTTGIQSDISGLVLGSERTYSVQAKDVAGNLSASRTVKFKINFNGMSVAPTIQVLSNTPDTVSMVSPKPVSVVVPPSGSQVPPSFSTPMPPRNDTVPPTAPTNFKAVADSSSQVTLSWSASTDVDTGVSYYVVYRNDADKQIAGGVKGTKYVDSGVKPSVTYTYRVSAFDEAGNESLKTSVTVKTPAGPVVADTIAPSTPTNFRVTASTTASLTFSWNASTDAGGIKGYSIYRDGNTTPRNPTPITSTVFTDSGLTPATTYTYTVEAIDNAGNKSAKGSATLKTPSTAVVSPTPPADILPPSVPQTFTATANSVSQITLAWGNAVDVGGIKGYNIYRNGGTVALNPTPVTALKYVDTGLTAATTYSYTIEAIDNAGNKSIKASASAKTADKTISMVSPNPVTVTVPTPVVTIDKTVPSVPASATVANVTVVPGAGWSTALSWGASTDNVGVTGYIVKSIAPTASTLTTTTGKTFTLTNLALTAGATVNDYTVSVQAKDARGNLGPARVIKFRLNFAGIGALPTVQIISNTVDTTVQKVVAQVPSTAPLTGAENTTKIETLTALMNKLIELKAMMASVKSSQ